MSGFGTDERPVARAKDPLLRFLAGCAVVALVLVLIALCVAWYVGSRLAQDEAPSRPLETFLVGDETRYWCLDLKPNDAGLESLFERLDAISDETRREALHGTLLERIRLPHRRARLDRLAPFTLEGSLFMSDPAQGPQVPLGWAVRGTFSHEVLRMRAGFKVMRWIISRDAGKSETIDVDGVSVIEVHDENAKFALANVGNRVLAANDAARMRAVLRSSAEPPLPRLSALHGDVKLDGEDAWAFVSNLRVGGLSNPLTITGGAASFDLSDRDELIFRVAVLEGGLVEEGSAFRGTREDCVAVASSFLPVFPAEAIRLDGDGARRLAPGSLVFTGSIQEVSKYIPEFPKRFAELVLRTTAKRLEDRPRPPSAPQTPSATPNPPSLPRPGGPRSGTPAAPTHEGSPKPPH